jgi:2-succinyl-6-hydroxy-2,4-cyclohexadiene-1-carboxylate synthase
MANQPAVPHDVIGGGDGRIVLLHGFTQTRHCWGSLPEVLASRTGRQAVVADAPGHGDAVDLALSLADAAPRYGDAFGPAVWLGYSMGGRMGLHVALARPDAVEALVLVGASPGVADPDERQRRRHADEQLAAHLRDVGVERFVDEWLAQPLFAGLSPTAAHRSQRLANTADGLAASLRLAGTGAQESLWDRLGTLRCPVLCVAGANDDKFTAIAHQMADLLPAGDVATVDAAGHSAHLEQPDAFAQVVADWLASAAPSRA